MNTQEHPATISPSDLSKKLQDSPDSLALIDVRTPAEFAALHIHGSTNSPLEHLRHEDNKETWPQDKPLVLICRSDKRAQNAQHKFAEAGWKNTQVLTGGIEAWANSGHPVFKNENGVISLERQVRIVAGFLVLIGAFLTFYINPLFFLLPSFVGGGLAFAGITDSCGMAMALARMPWNQKVACQP